MSADPTTQSKSAQQPIWLLIVRPIIILACFVVGCVALRMIVVRGTFMDNETTPKWSEDGIDITTARDAMRRGDFGQASHILKQLLLKQPNHGEAHQMLGRMYLQTGDRSRSLEHYRIALQYLPGNREAEHAVEMLSAESLGQAAGGANGSQPIRSGTNSTSSAAGSRRSP